MKFLKIFFQYYYKQEGDIQHLGFIDLNNVTKIEEPSEVEFELVTPARIFKLKAETGKVPVNR